MKANGRRIKKLNHSSKLSGACEAHLGGGFIGIKQEHTAFMFINLVKKIMKLL